MPNLTTIIVPKDTTFSLVGSKPIVADPKPTVIPLDDNDEILKNIAFLTAEGQKGGKRFYKKWLERSGKWFPMMRKIAAEENAPEELIYLSMIESGLKPTAISSAKAVGLWQFMRSTGEMYGLNATPSVWVDERRDPEKSTRAAMKHLKDLYAKFGDWHLALAAYNAGMGRIGRTLQRYASDSTSSYWDIREKLPKETQHYVPIYVATTKIALNPEAYGFKMDSLKYEDEYEYDTYILTEPISLSVIAKCLDTTREAIQELNPELLRSITPPDVENYTIKIPKNKLKTFAGRFSALRPEEKQPWIEHQVKRGETISQIAREYGIPRNEIATANNLPSYRSRLVNGSTIKIPLDKEYLAEKKKEDAERQKTIATNEKIIKDKNAVTHTVKSGETLYSIANKYGLRMADLRNFNNIPYDDDKIALGQKLIISLNSNKKKNEENSITNDNNNLASDNTTTAKDSTNKDKITQPTTKVTRHIVKSGETLHSISENYNVSIADLKTTNNLTSDNILVGQLLVVESQQSSGNMVAKTTGNTKEHLVKKGETLGMIAGTYGVSEDNLKQWNPKTIVGEKVFFGTTLKIIEPTTSKGSSQPVAKNVNVAPKYYKVQPGDTMSSIARKFGISLENLKARNKKVNPDNLLIGQQIRLQ
jgi:membrane-bound lytic murein transglycosylase D